MRKEILVFQTDFTYLEGAVCAMYGVVKSVDRELEIIDGTHQIPQYDTWSASYRLYQSMKFWPKGTVFVSVVDPGVGTKRRASVAKTADGYYVVSPDNGSFTHLATGVGITEIREIDETINRLKGKNTEAVSVFHGRDLFAYCAARLASGIITFEQVGKSYPVDKIVLHDILIPQVSKDHIEGIIEIEDPNFGNSWTNVSLKEFNESGFVYGDMVDVVITHGHEIMFNKIIPFHKSFGFVKKGEPTLYNNELLNISFALNQGSFMKKYKIGFGAEWKVVFTKA